MRRAGLNKGRLLLLGLLLLGLTGCQLGASPTQKRVTAIEQQTQTIKAAPAGATQRKGYTKLQAAAAKYGRTKQPAKSVTTAYRKALAKAKKAIRASDQQLLTQSTAKAAKNETDKTMVQKQARLTQLQKLVTADAERAYSAAGKNKVLQQITAAQKTNRETRIKVILINDDEQKYLDAYQRFSGKGHPVGEERGDEPTPLGFFDVIGMSVKRYGELYGGIFDYYGNAMNEGLLTRSQAEAAVDKALDQMHAGVYATHPIKITTMNFYQIWQGNYQSLVGNWVGIATGANLGDGKGWQWVDLPMNGKLTINRYHISDGQMTLRDTGDWEAEITDPSGKGTADFTYDDTTATYTANTPQIIWTISFLAKGTKNTDSTPHFNAQREHIVIAESMNRFVEVFERR